MIDDHIWLTWQGEPWAIRRIYRSARGRAYRFDLWRGYEPDLEFSAVDVTEVDWNSYCAKAADLLQRAEAGLVE